MCKMAVKDYNQWTFFKTNNASTRNAGIYSQNPVSKNENCEYSYFFEEKQGKPSSVPPSRPSCTTVWEPLNYANA